MQKETKRPEKWADDLGYLNVGYWGCMFVASKNNHFRKLNSDKDNKQ